MTHSVPLDQNIDPAPPKRRLTVTPAVELGVLALAVAVAFTTYLLLVREASLERLIAPGLIALLLVANILPGVALMVLFGRRVARRRAARSPIGGEGRLHVRLVVLFSAMATVPMLLVAIFASLLFQYGVQFWSSDRARGMLENSSTLAREIYQNEVDRVASETRAMSGDLAGDLQVWSSDSREFSRALFLQTFRRELSEAMIFRRDEVDPLVVLNPYDRPLRTVITPPMIAAVDRGATFVIVKSADRTGALVPLAFGTNTYLYAARVFDDQLSSQLQRGNAILADYRALQARSRSLQLRFNAALLAISLLIVGIAVWIALQVADRLVAPVGELVDAARRVEGGDLTARVAAPRTRDEVGTLASAFNQMTGRLQQQNTALVTANDQLESRRALIEAVMSGVSAGVVSIDGGGVIRIANRSARTLLGAGDDGLVGRSLAAVAPELADLVRDGTREEIVQLADRGEPRTLAVRIARADAGPILTFDDITQQLNDQRRAAWSDVARRIAHEIKNPLTPIQLAAERLQRRYGKTVEAGDTTFARLTETIVRQVGDLRRMVDEFSSFARMPKPVFRREALVDIVNQAVFLHEVAHPAIRFGVVHDDPGPALVCDRRQLGQAFTNIVKNAAEAIEATGRGQGAVTVTIAGTEDNQVVVLIEDDGIGLPPERDRIVEPYVTTRARGTGLGLAIVKKIVEEHCGTMDFTDRPGGGTALTIAFDAATLRTMNTEDDPSSTGSDRPLADLPYDRT